MKVLISGAGIAGTTLSYWLQRAGHEPTLVERAAQLRQGGYLIDFWGAGYEVAERMGIIGRLHEVGYHIKELREVSRRGRRIARLDPRSLLGPIGDRFISIARADLAAAIFDALPGVETIFGDSVAALDEDDDGVQVTFTSGSSRRFDLVVGADGLHSRVRRLVFGPEYQFEKNLGFSVAAFDVEGYEPREELVAITHTEVGAQTLRFTLRDGATMFFFTFRHEGPIPDDIEAQQQLLLEHMRDVGWEVPQILARLPEARTFYLDKASQIRMPSWSRGRVVLIGDAAACPSLLAGQGAALAMIEAYVLAAELARRNSDHTAAFTAYERQLAPLVREKQDAALGTASIFAPRNRRQLLFRNGMFKLMSLPFVSRLATRRVLQDPIELPTPPGA